MHEPSFIPTQFMNSSTKESLYVTLGAAENVANNKISEMSFTSGLVLYTSLISWDLMEVS